MKVQQCNTSEHETLRKITVAAARKRKGKAPPREKEAKIKHLLGKILQKQREDGYANNNFVQAADTINSKLKLKYKVTPRYLCSISASVNTTIKKGRWSAKECALFDAARRQGYSIKHIANVVLKRTRTPGQCHTHLRAISSKTSYDWNPKKVKVLAEAYRKHSRTQKDIFSYIAKNIFHEEVVADEVAYQISLLKKKTINEKWLRPETEKLFGAVSKRGRKWVEISQKVFKDKRSPEQCKRHYENIIARKIRRHQTAFTTKFANQNKLLGRLSNGSDAFFSSFAEGLNAIKKSDLNIISSAKHQFTSSDIKDVFVVYINHPARRKKVKRFYNRLARNLPFEKYQRGDQPAHVTNYYRFEAPILCHLFKVKMKMYLYNLDSNS